MINKKHFHKAGPVGFLCGAMLLAMLTGCVGYVDGPRAGIYVAPPVVEVGGPVFVAQDDYVYYPGYDVYYSSYRHQYAYLDGGVWVSRPQPMGVSLNVLLASPSVRMDFHDSPANHHAAIAQQYPRNWTASGAPHAQRAVAQKAQAPKAQARKTPVRKENQKGDEHEGK
jgi:hypothetical protein